MQHLREALHLSRQAAVHSLRHTKGDPFAALQNELAGFGLDDTALRRMAQEYAVYRQDDGPASAHSLFSTEAQWLLSRRG